jgi:hypothetical protein
VGQIIKVMNSLKGGRKKIELLIFGKRIMVWADEYLKVLNMETNDNITENDVMFTLLKSLRFMKVNNKEIRTNWLKVKMEALKIIDDIGINMKKESIRNPMMTKKYTMTEHVMKC